MESTRGGTGGRGNVPLNDGPQLVGVEEEICGLCESAHLDDMCLGLQPNVSVTVRRVKKGKGGGGMASGVRRKIGRPDGLVRIRRWDLDNEIKEPSAYEKGRKEDNTKSLLCCFEKMTKSEWEGKRKGCFFLGLPQLHPKFRILPGDGRVS